MAKENKDAQFSWFDNKIFYGMGYLGKFLASLRSVYHAAYEY